MIRAMSTERHEVHGPQEWGRAKSIRETKGLTAPQLKRYAESGMIRTSHIRRPGQTRGVRLYHIGDIDLLIAGSIENPTKRTTEDPFPN
jgi:hypothetical protein